MSITLQYAHSSAPPKKTRQRYRQGTDDIDGGSPSRRQGSSPPYTDSYTHAQPYADPYDYVSSSNTNGNGNNNNSNYSSQPRRSGGVPLDPSRDQPVRQRPPSYEAGSRSVEQSMNRSADAPVSNSTDRRRRDQPPPSSAHAQTATTATMATPTMTTMTSAAGRSQPAGARPGPSRPTQAQAQTGATQAALGNSIDRLKTPSVMETVLKPLGRKVQEYDRLMTEANADIRRLDDEIAQLQSQRDQAQARLMDATARHEDWQQQYTSVERTLKGELPQLPLGSTATMTAKAQPLPPPPPPPDHDSDDDYDDDDEVRDQRPWSASHQGSFASNKSKTHLRDRLRKSIFGA